MQPPTEEDTDTEHHIHQPVMLTRTGMQHVQLIMHILLIPHIIRQ